MAAAATAFPLFPKLPAELRIQIWRDAMPDGNGHAAGWFKPPSLEPRDQGRSPNVDFFEVRRDLMERVALHLPLFSVSCEARRETLMWARRRGFEKHARHDIFTRPFDAASDTLCVPIRQWGQVLDDPSPLESFEQNWTRIFCPRPPAVSRLAVTEVVLLALVASGSLFSVLRDYPRLEELLVVVDAPPDQLPPREHASCRPMGELVSAQGATLRWRGSEFVWCAAGRESKGDEALHKLLDVRRELGREFLRKKKLRFEARTVVALPCLLQPGR